MFLGVDGGGTKTAFVLINQDGKIVGRYRGPGSYYVDIGLSALEELLYEGVAAVTSEAGIKTEAIEYGFFGLPGYGEDSLLTDRLNHLPSKFIDTSRYLCNNDMVCGWAAGRGGLNGMHIVAGTGSIAYGENGQHRGRCGGWGELFGDEGSAYWIGIEALRLFACMADGRTPKASLYDRVRHFFSLRDDLDICARILTDWRGDRSKVAELSALVCEAAKAGDSDARLIFERAAVELARTLQALAAQLHFDPESTIYTTYSGGVFNAKELILQPLKQQLAVYCPNAMLTPSLYAPDIGAALYASRLAGVILPDDVLKHLQSGT